jgi:hypothetical protein
MLLAPRRASLMRVGPLAHPRLVRPLAPAPRGRRENFQRCLDGKHCLQPTTAPAPLQGSDQALEFLSFMPWIPKTGRGPLRERRD